MRRIIKEKNLYFICLSLFLLLGGIVFLSIEKPDAILFFSENRSTFANLFFAYGTKLGEEPMYFIFGLFFLTRKIRHSILIALIGLTVMGLSFALKSYFLIDRPLTFLRKNGLEASVEFVQGVNLHSAATSFPSGHSMSGFALYSLLILLLPNKKRFVIPLFLIAVTVAVSRVYLVQHFWEDVYVGATIGAVLAVLFYFLDGKMEGKLEGAFLKKSKVNVKN